MTDSAQGTWDTGYVQVYTGDGKGKSTAAFGLALRAAGAGLRVFIGQFAKGMRYSELEAFKRFSDCIDLRQFGRPCFLRREPTREDMQAARRGLEEVRLIFTAGRHRLVILDEANIATHFGLFSVDELLALIDAKPTPVELVITGRRADPRILERADLVTEMRELKHYYSHGIQARLGIES
jgi:cob(I)alamin adenosyltransferase